MPVHNYCYVVVVVVGLYDGLFCSCFRTPRINMIYIFGSHRMFSNRHAIHVLTLQFEWHIYVWCMMNVIHTVVLCMTCICKWNEKESLEAKCTLFRYSTVCSVEHTACAWVCECVNESRRCSSIESSPITISMSLLNIFDPTFFIIEFGNYK